MNGCDRLARTRYMTTKNNLLKLNDSLTLEMNEKLTKILIEKQDNKPHGLGIYLFINEMVVEENHLLKSSLFCTTIEMSKSVSVPRPLVIILCGTWVL